ncbi:hypothetical protein SM139_2960 [Stenotrophomonas maltophilia]|nr:hypothetical protein SM139_2960 [Stenotrophomonas maltophilia]
MEAAGAAVWAPLAAGSAALQAEVARIGTRPRASSRGVRVMGISRAGMRMAGLSLVYHRRRERRGSKVLRPLCERGGIV